MIFTDAEERQQQELMRELEQLDQSKVAECEVLAQHRARRGLPLDRARDLQEPWHYSYPRYWPMFEGEF